MTTRIYGFLKRLLIGVGFIIAGLMIICHSLKAENQDIANLAEFYATNYPNTRLNEKAKYLIDELNRQKITYSVAKQVYTIEVIYIYDEKGNQIWPVSRQDTPRNEGENLQKLEKNLREVAKLIGE